MLLRPFARFAPRFGCSRIETWLGRPILREVRLMISFRLPEAVPVTTMRPGAFTETMAF